MASGSLSTMPVGQAQVVKNPFANLKGPAGTVGEEYSRQTDEFSQNLPQYKQDLFEGAANTSKRNLVDRMAGIKTNANARGLLYGGLHQGAQQGATAEEAGNLAQQRYGINQALENRNDSMQQNLLNAQMEKYKGDVAANEKNYGLLMQRYGNDSQNRGNLLGGIAGIGGSIAGMFSDKDLKKNIKPGEREVEELLANIKPETYEYKDDSMGEGTHLSPMAQDLEKSEVGKSLVEDTPEGKVVDTGKGLGAIMAIQSALDKRLKKLEGNA